MFDQYIGTIAYFFRRDSKEIRFDRDLKKEIRKKFG